MTGGQRGTGRVAPQDPPAPLAALEEAASWQEEVYRQLHANPELPFEEVQTRALVRQRLTAFGFEVHDIGGGVVGVLENVHTSTSAGGQGSPTSPSSGPTVLVRADMDALPVTEATGLEYASVVDGVMHACGHDTHVTCALGAAWALSAHRDAWSGTYIALFQPAEEVGRGARSMVDDGLVDRVPRPDVCLAQHVLTEPGAGTVATAAGPVLSAGDSVRITVHGQGSHGSMPHLGVDPVVLASSIVMRLQTVVSRELAPHEFGVVTVGSLQAGTKANIIPATADLLVNLRAYDEGVRARIRRAIERIVRAECAAAGSPQDPEFDWFEAYPLTDNDAEVTRRVTAAFVDFFGPERVEHLHPVPASEDFSVIPDAFGVPYTYWGNGGFLPGMTVVPNHNAAFAPAIQPTLRTGTEALLVAALVHLGGADGS